jgi:hypothetical protein
MTHYIILTEDFLTMMDKQLVDLLEGPFQGKIIFMKSFLKGFRLQVRY